MFSPSDESFEIPINVIDDGIFEGNEPFQVSLSIPDNPPFGLNPSQTASTATITILDDEGIYKSSYYIATIRYGLT